MAPVPRPCEFASQALEFGFRPTRTGLRFATQPCWANDGCIVGKANGEGQEQPERPVSVETIPNRRGDFAGSAPQERTRRPFTCATSRLG